MIHMIWAISYGPKNTDHEIRYRKYFDICFQIKTSLDYIRILFKFWIVLAIFTMEQEIAFKDEIFDNAKILKQKLCLEITRT